MPYTSQYSKTGISRNAADKKYANNMDIPTLKAYSHYLIMKGQAVGLTVVDGHKLSAEELDVQKEIRRACDEVERTLLNCNAGDIACLTDFYFSLFIIGYHKLPDASFRGKQTDRLLRSWKAGDKTVEESDVYEMLCAPMQYSIPSMSANILSFFGHLRDRWVKTLKTYSTFPDTTTYERYKRLALIMKDNVDSYFGGDGSVAKKVWFEKNKIAELSVVSTKILTVYRQFVCSLYPTVLNHQKMITLDIEVLKELIGRHDLSDYDRKAYLMALSFESRY